MLLESTEVWHDVNLMDNACGMCPWVKRICFCTEGEKHECSGAPTVGLPIQQSQNLIFQKEVNCSLLKISMLPGGMLLRSAFFFPTLYNSEKVL